MGYGRNRLRFSSESSQRTLILRHPRWQNLDRDVPVESGIPGSVDLPHASRPERRDDVVRPEARSFIQQSGSC